MSKMQITIAQICKIIDTGIHFSDWTQFQSPIYLHSRAISACHTATPAKYKGKMRRNHQAVLATPITLLSSHIKHEIKHESCPSCSLNKLMCHHCNSIGYQQRYAEQTSSSSPRGTLLRTQSLVLPLQHLRGKPLDRTHSRCTWSCQCHTCRQLRPCSSVLYKHAVKAQHQHALVQSVNNTVFKSLTRH